MHSGSQNSREDNAKIRKCKGQLQHRIYDQSRIRQTFGAQPSMMQDIFDSIKKRILYKVQVQQQQFAIQHAARGREYEVHPTATYRTIILKGCQNDVAKIWQPATLKYQT